MESRTNHFGDIIEEMINNELKSYKRLYLKDREIKNIILVGIFKIVGGLEDLFALRIVVGQAVA